MRIRRDPLFCKGEESCTLSEIKSQSRWAGVKCDGKKWRRRWQKRSSTVMTFNVQRIQKKNPSSLSLTRVFMDADNGWKMVWLWLTHNEPQQVSHGRRGGNGWRPWETLWSRAKKEREWWPHCSLSAPPPLLLSLCLDSFSLSPLFLIACQLLRKRRWSKKEVVQKKRTDFLIDVVSVNERERERGVGGGRGLRQDFPKKANSG